MRGVTAAKGLKCVATLAVAATADGLQIAFPAFWIPISIITAITLFLLWGWRWEILVVLVPELAPVIGILPTWTGVAIYLTGREIKTTNSSGEDHPPEMRNVGPRSKKASSDEKRQGS